jgi:CRISPR-associated protein Cmr2
MQEALPDQEVPLPTFSMGIAVVHQASPLNRSLDLARSAERTAKEAGGRAALAIIQSKRSGSDIAVCGKWQGDDGALGLVERLESLVALYNQGILSSRLGYQLRRLADEGGRSIAYATTDSGRLVPQNATSAEALRLICRKQTQEGNVMDETQQRGLLAGQNDLREMADEMVIARQFAEAQTLASAGWLNENAARF